MQTVFSQPHGRLGRKRRVCRFAGARLEAGKGLGLEAFGARLDASYRFEFGVAGEDEFDGREPKTLVTLAG